MSRALEETGAVVHLAECSLICVAILKTQTHDMATPTEYIQNIDEARRPAFERLRETIQQNLSPDFAEEMAYGMVSYVVPHSIYPPGYHCDPKQALPFVSIAAQKNFLAVYHMGVYTNPELLEWFVTEYGKLNLGKLDMGKSCIRFKNVTKIPFELIGRLMQQMSMQNWLDLYQSKLKR